MLYSCTKSLDVFVASSTASSTASFDNKFDSQIKVAGNSFRMVLLWNFFIVWNTQATAIKHFVKADIFQTANSLHFKTNWNTQGHAKHEFEV